MENWRDREDKLKKQLESSTAHESTAVSYLELAKLYQKNGCEKEYIDSTARYKLTKGHIESLNGNYDEARDFFLEAEELFLSIYDRHMAFFSSHAIIRNHSFESKNRGASVSNDLLIELEHFIEKYADFSSHIYYQQAEAYCYQRKALLASKEKKYARASELHLKAAATYGAIGDEHQRRWHMAEHLMINANTKNHLKQFREAKRFFEQAEQYFLDSGSKESAFYAARGFIRTSNYEITNKTYREKTKAINEFIEMSDNILEKYKEFSDMPDYIYIEALKAHHHADKLMYEDIKQAAAMYLIASNKYKKANDEHSKKWTLAKHYFVKGNIKRNENDYEEACQFFEKSEVFYIDARDVKRAFRVAIENGYTYNKLVKKNDEFIQKYLDYMKNVSVRYADFCNEKRYILMEIDMLKLTSKIYHAKEKYGQAAKKQKKIIELANKAYSLYGNPGFRSLAHYSESRYWQLMMKKYRWAKAYDKVAECYLKSAEALKGFNDCSAYHDYANYHKTLAIIQKHAGNEVFFKENMNLAIDFAEKSDSTDMADHLKRFRDNFRTESENEQQMT